MRQREKELKEIHSSKLNNYSPVFDDKLSFKSQSGYVEVFEQNTFGRTISKKSNNSLTIKSKQLI